MQSRGHAALKAGNKFQSTTMILMPATAMTHLEPRAVSLPYKANEEHCQHACLAVLE